MYTESESVGFESGFTTAEIEQALGLRSWINNKLALRFEARNILAVPHDGVAKADLQRNSRLGLTLALPTGRHHSLKLAWATGFTTRIGGEPFGTFALGMRTRVTVNEYGSTKKPHARQPRLWQALHCKNFQA
jgi:hypothetical protein